MAPDRGSRVMVRWRDRRREKGSQREGGVEEGVGLDGRLGRSREGSRWGTEKVQLTDDGGRCCTRETPVFGLYQTRDETGTPDPFRRRARGGVGPDGPKGVVAVEEEEERT